MLSQVKNVITRPTEGQFAHAVRCRRANMARQATAALAMGIAALGLAQGRAADQITPIGLHQVKVGGEIGRRIDLTVRENLLALDMDNDFLRPFRERTRGGGYIGLGKLIDSLVRFAAYTSDEQVLELKKRVVSETIETQEREGYIGIIAPDKRMWTLWDVHEMVYIVYGLTNDYRYFGDKASLDAARGLADYLITRWSAEPQKQPGGGQIAVHMAVTGLESALLALHGQTGDDRYQDFCEKDRKLSEWDYPIVVGRWGQIGGHAYAYLCRCVAQLRLYRVRPNDNLLRQARRVVRFLTERDGLVITGTCGYHECWHDNQDGTMNLGETCATAYLVRFLDEFLRLEGESRYGDLMERSVYNALFAAQSPDGRHIRYYTPFDGPRAYFKGDTYCCPNNYRRIIAELPTMIYYRWGDGVLVNVYTSSTAEIELDSGLSVSLRQETDYPNSGRVVIRVAPSRSARFPLRLRIPGWCPNAKAAVSGQPMNKAIPRGSFLTIRRQWRAGDRIELEFPMSWRLVKGRQAQAGRVAVMRGPLLFCLNRARHKELADVDLRLITLDPSSLEGPIKDNTVRPEGLACEGRAWSPGSWYPMAKTDLRLVLTEFADPRGEATYFNVPNPKAEGLVEDELIRLEKAR